TRAWPRRARRSRRTSATARPRSSSATPTSPRASRRRMRWPTRSSTSGGARATRSCTRGRTASSSTMATARTCATWCAASSRRRALRRGTSRSSRSTGRTRGATPWWRAELAGYDKYLRFRQLLATEHDRRAGAGISATIHFRDRDQDVSLLAHRCRRCGTMQYPFQRVCYRCYAKDDFDKVRLSDRRGTLKSFTFDYFAGSPDPPLIATVTDV